MAGHWYHVRIEKVTPVAHTISGTPVWTLHLSNGQFVHTAWDFEVGKQINESTTGEFNAYCKGDRVLYLNPLKVGVR